MAENFFNMFRAALGNNPPYLQTLEDILQHYEVAAQNTDDELELITQGMQGLSNQDEEQNVTAAYFDQIKQELQETKQEIYNMLSSEELEIIQDAVQALSGSFHMEDWEDSEEDSDDDCADSEDEDNDQTQNEPVPTHFAFP